MENDITASTKAMVCILRLLNTNGHAEIYWYNISDSQFKNRISLLSHIAHVTVMHTYLYNPYLYGLLAYRHAANLAGTGLASFAALRLNRKPSKKIRSRPHRQPKPFVSSDDPSGELTAALTATPLACSCKAHAPRERLPRRWCRRTPTCISGRNTTALALVSTETVVSVVRLRIRFRDTGVRFRS